MALDLTGISNVNEFYSHHYLDSLLEGDLKGLYKKWQENEDRSPYEKLSGIALKYFRAKTDAFNEKKPEDRVEVTRKFHINFLEALDYDLEQKVKFTENGQALPVLTTVRRDGNEHLWIIETVFWADDVSIFEQSMVFNKQNNEVNWFEDSIDTAIQEIFRLEEPPRWLILLAGQKVYLIDRNKWGQGKYLLFDLDEIFGRKQTETLKATAALLSKDAIAPEEGNILHDELDENSHKHAFSVSEDLKYGIRRAVELIGNEFIYYRSKVAKQKIYGDEELANKLTKECLSYLYRLLFLFYAESRSEQLNVVPMNSEEYRLGYSLETLRELELVSLTTEASREGYFLHESLTTLFKIVNEGFGNDDQFEMDYESGNYVDVGFVIDGLQSPLFDPIQTPLLSSVKFRNFVLQEVIQLLSLSKEGSKQRGRISYAQLGINQLGAVYEGLLSYSGFFAQETLYEVKPANVNSTDETGQSYFVPESEINLYKDDEFVLFKDDDGINRRKKYEKGSFIFRLAGRDREKSASYYTPEVLTQSLVKYSLKELLKNKNADEILELTICEPAMGSGAFLNEAINQLADVYLERKQKELGESISPENYAHEKQRVNAYFATNNIYGVDLNPTAVELAKVSLWLNTIYKGSKTPWFSGRLAVGNSLIGANKQVYYEDDLITGKWVNKIPEKLQLDKERHPNTIYHFLIADKGMVPFDKDKIVRDIAKEDIHSLKKWQQDFFRKYDLEEVKSLKGISNRIDRVWGRLIKNRLSMLENTKEQINIWGQPKVENEKRKTSIMFKEKELNNIKSSPTSAYRSLKFIMNYWCSLWFWPLDKANLLPTRDEFLLDISVILDSADGYGTNLNDLVNNIERLNVVSKIASTNHFFHWELEFPEVFFNNNGFDLIIGNPPWIKIGWEEKGVLSDYVPLINLRKMNATKVKDIRNKTLEKPYIKNEYLSEYVSILGQQSFLKSNLYSQLEGVKLNLYKSFIILSLNITNPDGISSFIHLEGIYDDPKGGKLREYLYPKLVAHFQFINELKLFDIDHHNSFGCSIFTPKNKEEIGFINVSNLFHPKTLDESFNHIGEGLVTGIKNDDDKWNTLGHKKRIIKYDYKLLSIINSLYESSNENVLHTKILNIHSTDVIKVLDRLSNYKYKLRHLEDDYYNTVMFDETKAQNDNITQKDTFWPDNVEELVYQGPHFFVATPFNKTPKEECNHNLDYEKIDLTTINSDFLPRSNYRLLNKDALEVFSFHDKPVTKYYRQIFRNMLSPTGERTLVGCLIPKGVTHINGCRSVAINNLRDLVAFSGLTSSIITDFYVKSTGRSNLSSEILNNLPIPSSNEKLLPQLISRTLRLNCITEEYADLWSSLFNSEFCKDSFAKQDSRLSSWSQLNKEWQPEYSFKSEYERRQALVEIDVISGLILNLSIQELISIYKMQFPVLQSYEKNTFYDQTGAIVYTTNRSIPNVGVKKTDWEQIQGIMNIEELPDNLKGIYDPPFDNCDREADMRQAYEFFSKILNDEKAKGEINV